MTVQADRPDGYQSFQGGMNEGVSPSRIGSSQTQKNVNISLKKNSLKPRPPLRQVSGFTFSEASDLPFSGAISYRENFLTGRAQHNGKYQTEFGEYIVRVINGVIYLVNPRTWLVTPIPVAGFSPIAGTNCTQINGHQADRYYVIYDWPNTPIVIENFTARRADQSNQEIPRAYIGTFVQNRIFAGNAGIEFGASDPVSPSNPLAPITFKESIVDPDTNPSPAYPEQFFALSYVERLSNITAMGFLKQTDGTSPLGFGPLFVSTKEAIHLFRVNEPRSRWEEIEFGSAYIFNYGVVGQKAQENVGPDLFYRSFDGQIYSTATLYSDQRRWGNTHISREIEDSLLTVNKDLLHHSALGYFENKLYVTLQPFVVEAKSLFGRAVEDYVFNGFGVMEINNTTGLTAQNSSPVWSSMYSGQFNDVLEVDNRLFFFGRSCKNNQNAIWEVEDSQGDDWIPDTHKPIRSRVYTKEFNFDTTFQDKVLKYVHFDVRNVLGAFKIEVLYRLNNDCCWSKFGNICYNSSDSIARGSIRDEFIYASDEADGGEARFKSIQFRFDIEGSDYEIVSFTAFADLCTENQPDRRWDTEKFEGFSDLGDNDLCH